jgi:hypothetical protein
MAQSIWDWRDQRKQTRAGDVLDGASNLNCVSFGTIRKQYCPLFRENYLDPLDDIERLIENFVRQLFEVFSGFRLHVHSQFLGFRQCNVYSRIFFTRWMTAGG